MKERPIYKIGIDEVGRGPIAGPVAVCAFLIKDDSFLNDTKEKKLPKLRDSKKLSKKQREVWFEFLKVAKTEGFCDYEVSFVSPDNIDKFGIAKCIQKALDKSLKRVASSKILFERSSDLLANNSSSEGRSSARPSQKDLLIKLQILLDGGLHAPSEYINQETVIKGDEIYPVISMASIMAKVTRDRVMTKYSTEYPEYGFDKHVGYGTKAHYDAIKKYGKTPIHRKSFIH